MYSKQQNSIVNLMDENFKEELRAELKEELRREILGEVEEQARSEDDYPWIVFSIDETEYGVNSRNVLSIEILGEITPIVDGPAYCPGITRSRGEMIELLDLRSLFGLGDYISAKENTQDDQYMMMVIESGNAKLGVIVDRIVSVEYITQFDTGPAGISGDAVTSKYVRQIAKREKENKPLLIIKPESLYASCS